MLFELLYSIDSGILLFIQDSIRNSVLDPIMTFFSVIGNAGALWIALAILLMINKKYRRIGFDVLLCVALCYIINDFAVKNTIQRVRPFLAVDGLEFMLGSWSLSETWSFPSGHTCSSFAAAYALTMGFGKKGALFYIPAFFISFSRLYIGVHYPSDVLAGALIGTLGSIGIYKLSQKYIRLRKVSE